MYDFATQKWTDIAKASIGDYSFYPDSSAVFYSDADKQAMFRVRLSDHKVEQVADLRMIDQPALPYWPAWVGVTPDGAPLLMRDLGTREIYALELEK